MAALNFTTADQPNTSDGHTERAVFAARPVAAGELLLTEQPFASRHMHSLSLSLSTLIALFTLTLLSRTELGAQTAVPAQSFTRCLIYQCDSGGNYRLHLLSVT